MKIRAFVDNETITDAIDAFYEKAVINTMNILKGKDFQLAEELEYSDMWFFEVSQGDDYIKIGISVNYNDIKTLDIWMQKVGNEANTMDTSITTEFKNQYEIAEAIVNYVISFKND